MGRLGSKGTTSDYLRLDVRYLQRNGFLQPGRFVTLQWSRNGEPFASTGLLAGSGCVRLTYRHRRCAEEWKDQNYPVSIEWMPCNYGGARAWFHCPATGCGRRVAILYGGGIFACRHCYRLAYDSQREAPHDRALRRAQAIRERLAGSPNMFEPFPMKPKGMHWRTYQQLYIKAEKATERSWPPWILKCAASWSRPALASSQTAPGPCYRRVPEQYNATHSGD